MPKAMIIAAHPDDAELMMGGTIAKMILNKWEVLVVDLTDGEPTPFGSRTTRRKETRVANEALGLARRICLNMPNRHLTANLTKRRQLAEAIRKYSPDMLFGPVNGDYHPDHVCARLLLHGARFEAKLHKTTMHGSPHWTRRQYFYYSPNKIGCLSPSIIIDVSETWEQKIKAIRAYRSQLYLQNEDHTPKLIDMVTTMGRFYGQCIGARYGEPFMCSEAVGTSDVNVLLG